MRNSLNWIWVLLRTTLLTVQVAGQATPNINITQHLELPTCAQECGTRVLAAYSCMPTEPCFCEQSGPKVDALAFCLKSECTLAGSLASLKFQADACNFPIRDEGHIIAIVSYTLFAVATGFVIARFISRIPKLHGAGYGADDWIVLFAYVPMVGMTVVAYYEHYYGSGRDVWEVPLSYLEPFALWFFIGQPMYIVVTYCTKLSLVFLYLRIWHDEPRSSFRITCWIVATSLILCTIGCTLAAIFPCQPIDYSWRQVLPGVTGQCANRTAAAFAFSGINIAYDVIVLLIPIPRFVGMKIPLHKKIGVCSCFLVGFAVTAISIIRLTSLSALTNSRNPTWDFAAPGFWSLVEVYGSMVCCCMPASAGLLHRLWGYATRGQWSERLRSLSSKGSESKLVRSRRESGQKGVDDALNVEKLERGSPGESWVEEGMGERPNVARIPSAANVLMTVESVPERPRKKGRGEERKRRELEKKSRREKKKAQEEEMKVKGSKEWEL